MSIRNFAKILGGAALLSALPAIAAAQDAPTLESLAANDAFVFNTLLFLIGGGTIVIVKLSLERPELDIKWEESRNGEKFPHAYGDLTMDDVLSYRKLLPDRNGRYVFEAN